MSAHRIIRLQDDPTGKVALAEFVDNLQVGKAAFRYFENRPIDIVDSHLATLLLIDGDEVVAYGHLEEEGSRLWLGIAVADAFTGRGLGTVMMAELDSAARDSTFDRISLRVDLENKAGIALYEKQGFQKVRETNQTSSLLMEKMISHCNDQRR